MTRTFAAVALVLTAIAGSAPIADAQTTDLIVPGHPRVSEVDRRLLNQQKRVNHGVGDGAINGAQAARDESRDGRIARELSADQAAHGGHITQAEQNQLNRQLNRNSNAIHRQAHPAQVPPPAQ